MPALSAVQSASHAVSASQPLSAAGPTEPVAAAGKAVSTQQLQLVPNNADAPYIKTITDSQGGVLAQYVRNPDETAQLVSERYGISLKGEVSDSLPDFLYTLGFVEKNTPLTLQSHNVTRDSKDVFTVDTNRSLAFKGGQDGFEFHYKTADGSIRCGRVEPLHSDTTCDALTELGATHSVTQYDIHLPMDSEPSSVDLHSLQVRSAYPVQIATRHYVNAAGKIVNTHPDRLLIVNNRLKYTWDPKQRRLTTGDGQLCVFLNDNAHTFNLDSGVVINNEGFVTFAFTHLDGELALLRPGSLETEAFTLARTQKPDATKSSLHMRELS